MSTFLNSLSDKLEAMEQEIQALPEELDSIVRRLDRGKWENLLLRVNEDFNKLLDKLSTPQSTGIFPFLRYWTYSPFPSLQ